MKCYSAWQKTRKDKWKLRVCIVMFYAKLWLFFLFGRHFNHKIPDTDHFSYSLFINLIISLVPVANFGQISHFKVSYLQPVPSLIFILLLFFIRLFLYICIYITYPVTQELDTVGPLTYYRLYILLCVAFIQSGLKMWALTLWMK